MHAEFAVAAGDGWLLAVPAEARGSHAGGLTRVGQARHDLLARALYLTSRNLVFRVLAAIDGAARAVKLVLVDEAQLWQPHALVELRAELRRRGVWMVVAGLRADYFNDGNEFEYFRQLAAQGADVRRGT